MLSDRVCGEFESIWRFFSDDLTESREYDFKSSMLKNYCPKPGNCNNDIDKINAGCLWLFNKFYGNNSNFSIYANGNMNIVVYFMTWLSYKLNQKPQSGVNKFNDFYSKHMKNVKEYTNNINDVTGYTSYIDLINKKENLMDIDIELMSKFYDLFKNLCKMYNDFSKKSNNSKKYIEYAKEFADEYKKLFNDNDNNIKGSSYDQILTTLSNDYNYFRNSYVSSNIGNTLPELITEKTTQVSVSNPIEGQDVSLSEIPELKSETDVSSSKDKVSDSDSGSPSSSILNKLISIPFIFVATLILLGIAYKYSLFGFRKRSQKHLREKIKK
ncbi:PIR protein [Plasmodium yoelii]|uniref:PIR protein n=2 Tax=Plasmodium yoelii TaxID=5861 RepID=A0AAE9WS86_PLAYO|nr:PIR protein [Plasmodium yoelii]WBY56162.1 PIR protein [Plasmodium yoelii yoelii]VTZ75624.1 PIR protein [Plasmodium yoelii]|eukprot:XP_034493434.1 PIR protein [Plasmodium yoelii]